MKQILDSERISFVEVSEELADDYLVMVNDHERVNRFIGGDKKTYTQEQEIQWVRKKLEEKATVYSMIDKKSRKYIGNIEFMDLAEDEAELGIAITGEMQALIRYGMDQLGLKRIFLRTNPANHRARHVYEKCGFREYNRDEEHVYMELLR